MTQATLIKLDRRRRVTLGSVGRPEHTLYLATTAPDGTITLTPAKVSVDTAPQTASDG